MGNSDRDGLLEVCDNCFSEAGFPEAKTFSFLGDHHLILFWGKNPSSYSCLVDPHVEFEIGKDELKVHDILVARPYEQRRGIGTQWVSALCDLAKKSGVNRITAYSLETPAARGFWDSIPGMSHLGDRNYQLEVQR